MIRTRFLALAFVIIILPAHGLADETNLSRVFAKVMSAYKGMKTYKAQGTITSDIDSGGMKMTTRTEFSMIMKKPNLYRISWTQKNHLMPIMAQSGAVWSDGTQAYLFMGVMNAYSKMPNDALALAAATGISSGAADTIPSLFLSVFKEEPPAFSRLTDPKLEKVEEVENEECYVISGSSTISKKETFWISKTRYLIIKYSWSFEPHEGGRVMPETTDEELQEAIKAMGMEVTEGSKRSMRDVMKRAANVLQTAELKGSSIELYTEISSPRISQRDFQYAPSEGAILKESLFGSILGGGE